MRLRLVRFLSSTAATAAVVLVGVAGSSAAPQAQTPVNATERVSVDSFRGQGDNGSFEPVISRDARFVAFASYAANLVPGDTNGAEDVFVHDRQTGATERVSVDSFGGQGDRFSNQPAISDDGRLVAFGSYASNLVSGDTNGMEDVFVHDRQTGATERVSVDSFGGQADNYSFEAATSADGRFIVFSSYAANLVPGDTNSAEDVFVHDRQAGTTQRVSVDSFGRQGNKLSAQSAISAEGRFVAFLSDSNHLVPDDTDQHADIFVHDGETGMTERVSVDSFGGQADGWSNEPAISADGRFIAFGSNATNLVPDDTNESVDVFAHDRQTGATERVSVDSFGGQGNSTSAAPALSADGRFVAFSSYAKTLVPGDTNHVYDVFIHDRQNGATERVSVDSLGAQGNGASGNDLFVSPAISADDRFVAFPSLATNLVPADTNGAEDAFVHRRHAPQIYSFGPTSGITGSTVTIEGVNFDGTTSVMFGKKRAKFKVLSATEIRATVPNGATSAPITVSNPDGTAKSPTDYTVTFSITKLMPKSGAVGTVATLTGIGFGDVTSVKFHGVSASFTILTPTSIRATVPVGATTGKVTATSSQGTVTGPKFTVTP